MMKQTFENMQTWACPNCHLGDMIPYPTGDCSFKKTPCQNDQLCDDCLEYSEWECDDCGAKFSEQNTGGNGSLPKSRLAK